MFEIKICGVKRQVDIDAVAKAAKQHEIKTAIGLNFFPKSVRYVDPSQAATRQLSEHATSHGLVRVGVFVNETADQMQRIGDDVGLDVIQMHGDEPLTTAQQLIDAGHQVIRAVKLPTVDLSADHIHDQTIAWLDLGCHVLLDADAGAAHGGSGKTLDWQIISLWATQHPSARWTLAGGLKPENLAQAVTVSLARSVDTASGAELERGTKSSRRIEQFFAAMP